METYSVQCLETGAVTLTDYDGLALIVGEEWIADELVYSISLYGEAYHGAYWIQEIKSA